MTCDWCGAPGEMLSEHQAKCTKCHHEWQTGLEWDWDKLPELIEEITKEIKDKKS